LLQFPLLDYGCGRGKDVAELGCDGYDPHWSPMNLSGHSGFYQTILCTYVLCVLDEETSDQVLADIRRLLRPGGTAYITVRRDLKEYNGVQRYVELDLPVLHKNSGFCIYTLTSNPD
jgi:SAM-dependent methyltransferase